MHMEFGDQQCQILWREQLPVALGLRVSFLLLCFPERMKTEEGSWKTPPQQSDSFSNQGTGSHGKHRHSRNTRASPGTSSMHWVSLISSLAGTLTRAVTAIYLLLCCSRTARLPAWLSLAARCFARCSECGHVELFPGKSSLQRPNVLISAKGSRANKLAMRTNGHGHQGGARGVA